MSSHGEKLLARALKRKRSSDVASECTHTTECTEASQVVLDEKTQKLADQRAQHAAEKLELEQQLKQLEEQRQHVALQLEQLEGVEGGKDQIGLSDLKQQLQSYAEQHKQATSRLFELDSQFESAVASILGITPEQQPHLLAEALQEQQQLQDLQVQQLAIEQQLGGSDFAVTHSRPHKSKQARLDKMSSVWDWLSSADGNSTAAEQQGPAPASQGQQQQSQQQQQQQQHDEADHQPEQQSDHQQQPQSQQSMGLGSSLHGAPSSQQMQVDVDAHSSPKQQPQQQQQPPPLQEHTVQAAA